MIALLQSGYFVCLLAAHVVGDFPAQPERLVRAKRTVSGLVLHGAVVAVLSAWLAGAGTPCWWQGPGGDVYLAALKIATGVVAQVWIGGILVGYGLRPFTRQMDPPPASLAPGRRGFDNGGRIIGYLERLLVYFFVLSDQAAAVGFLVTAKSVFRFGELKDGEHRNETEYIIIGSLASFAYALPVAWLVRRWL